MQVKARFPQSLYYIHYIQRETYYVLVKALCFLRSVAFPLPTNRRAPNISNRQRRQLTIVKAKELRDCDDDDGDDDDDDDDDENDVDATSLLQFKSTFTTSLAINYNKS